MRVYVAGPITKGDQFLNVRRALEAAQLLVEAGHAPYVPHLTVFHHLVFPGPYEQWLALDNAWLDVCEALIRLPGESAGADAEQDRAIANGIPVFEGADGPDAVAGFLAAVPQLEGQAGGMRPDTPVSCSICGQEMSLSELTFRHRHGRGARAPVK